MPLSQIVSASIEDGAVAPVDLSSVAQYYGFKNRIINGGMVIDQRNAGASVTPTSPVYTLDRWFAGLSQSSKYSVQRNAGSVTPPTGFINYFGATSLSAYSVLSTDSFNIQQRIEGFNFSDLAWGTASAATVTLSFWVRSSLTGTHSGALWNNAFNRSYPFTFTINSANTWEQKSITITGDTSGTWTTDNSIGLGVSFNLGSGSSYLGTAGAWGAAGTNGATGSVSVVGTNGATFYITGVQLEKGVTATSFDYRPYGTELQLCQRYCVQWNGTNLPYATGQVNSATVCYSTIPFAMRATPTAAFLSVNVNDAGVANALSSVININMGSSGGGFGASSSGLTVGRCGILYGTGASSYLRFDAEL